MYTSTDFTNFDTLHLDIEILAEVLKLSQELVFWIDMDVLSDAPEWGKSAARAEETLQLTHRVMEKIEKAVKDGDLAKSRQANHILDEAEEAFGVRSLAKERAACGNWDPPETIADYLLWIEAEAAIQEELGEDPVYVRALQGVAGEMRTLGFEPSPPPWEEGAVV
jgi:hypothetical protein